MNYQLEDSGVASFYEDHGDDLVDPKNYPAEINSYLEYERNVLSKLIKDKEYQFVIEVGCMVCRSLYLSVENDIKYLGIDIVERYIDDANRKIKNCGLVDRASARLLSVFDLSQKAVPDIMKNNTLVYFPFNSFGNLHSQDFSLIRVLQELQADIYIATYQTTSFAKRVREKYYSMSGYGGIVCTESSDGVTFKSKENLNSIALATEYFEDRFFETLGDVNIDDHDDLYRGVHVVARQK